MKTILLATLFGGVAVFICGAADVLIFNEIPNSGLNFLMGIMGYMLYEIDSIKNNP